MSAQASIDTNVLVRLLVSDDASQQALASYEDGAADFADCLHLALPFLTFDAQASRLDGACLLGGLGARARGQYGKCRAGGFWRLRAVCWVLSRHKKRPAPSQRGRPVEKGAESARALDQFNCSALVRSPITEAPLAFNAASREARPGRVSRPKVRVIRRSTEAVSYWVWSTVPFLARGEITRAGMRVPGPIRSPLGGATWSQVSPNSS